MELKMSRLHEGHQEQKSKQMNTVLLVLSLLSIVSVITDLSQWLDLVGVSTRAIYSPLVAISTWIAIGFLALWYIRKTKPFD